jgi:hypothetical protein
MTMAEIALGGGNVSGGVVRIGDTVRRPAGPWTPAVHALLDYLHAAGFHGAPRPLGLDELGREVLTFIPGTIPWPGSFALLDPDDRLRRAARLIRDFHDAVTGFCPLLDARWQALIPTEGTGIIANPRYQRGDPAHRMRLFADAYGLDQAQREELLPMLAHRTKAMYDFLARQAVTGAQPWTRLWHAGHGRAWRADTDYITEREDTWRQALLD